MRVAIKQIEATAPAVASVAVGQHRPLWSVMIPTFNCAQYLRLTLQSVLVQDPGCNVMQIEVVDDCSTKDDPEAVVQEVGQGRVQFYRKRQNGGAIANFNTCIERSRGRIVHILHGDDLVMPGFYHRIAAIAESHPEIALFACRSLFIDETNIVTGVSARIQCLENGGKDASAFYYRTPVFTPAVAVRRDFYEGSGGFIPSLVHTADCEMWARAISVGGGLIVPDVLTQYRMFSGSDTGRLVRTAENLADVKRLNSLMALRYADFVPRVGLMRLTSEAANQAQRFLEIGDRQAYRANMDFYRANAPLLWRFKRAVKSSICRLTCRSTHHR